MTNLVPDDFEPFPEMDGFVGHVGPLYRRVVGDKGSFGFLVQAHHANPVGICHGGMMMSVMDMAVGHAVMLKRQNTTFTPSINMTYDFLMPAKIGDWLYSDVDFVHTSRRMGFANGVLRGPAGPVLRCNGICQIPRDDDPLFGRQDHQAAFINQPTESA